MHDLTDTLCSPRAEPIQFDLGDGEIIQIRAPSIAQATACVRLDPKPGAKETAAEHVVRVARQARILLGPEHAHLMDRLAPWQIVEIVSALYLAASGLEPTAYVRWQQERRDLGLLANAQELLRRLDALTIELSAEMRLMPDDIGTMPLADAVSLREQLKKLERARAETQAIIAGVKLRWNS